MKLVKITKGLYRSESGGLILAHRPWTKPECWWMEWKDFIGCKHVQRFFTLKDARKYLKTHA